MPIQERVELVTAPAEEPVTLTEAKLHLRVDIDADNALIATEISAARRWVEGYTGRSLVTQTRRLWLDQFPPCLCWQCRGRTLIGRRSQDLATIHLPGGKVQSIAEVKYADVNGVVQTIAGTDYVLDAADDDRPARLYPAPDKTWPGTQDIPSAVQVKYVAGFGLPSTGLPAVIDADYKQGILLFVGSMYENRESEVTGTIATKLNHSIEMLLYPRRIFTLA